MKPCEQVLQTEASTREARTKSSRQAPRTKSPGTKPSRQAPRTKSPRTKPSRQAPRSKSPRTKPSRQVPRSKSSRQAPRTKSPGTKSSRQAPRMKPCRQVPRANPTDHTSLPMYVWGTFNSGFPTLRYGVKSHFFRFGHSSDDRRQQRHRHTSAIGTLQMTGHQPE